MKYIFLSLLLCLTASAQQTTYSLLKIGDHATILPSAILEVKSTTAGMLLPRMTTTQKMAISSPATGLLVYDTTLNTMSAWSGSTWLTLGGGTIDGVGVIDSGTPSSNGASVGSGGTLLILQSASAFNPGLVNNGSQSWTGTKTFGSNPVFSNMSTAGVVLNATGGALSSSSGPLAIANGGNNSSVALNNNRVMVSSGGTIGELNLSGISGQVLSSNGSSSSPSWITNILGNAGNITASSNSTLTTLSSLSLPTSQLSGTVSNAQLATAPKFTVKGNATSVTASVADGQSIMLGTPNFPDTGIGFQITGSASNYFQGILQNTNSGSASSADYIVNNNLGTATTFYGDFGMNSSGFTGTGSLSLPNATYVFSQNGDLTLGTNSLNNIHMTVNNGSTDALIVNTSNKLIFPGLTGYLFGNGSTAVTASNTVPFTSLSGTATIAQGGTNSGVALNNNRMMVSSGGTIAELSLSGLSGQIMISNGVALPTWGTNAPVATNITGKVAIANGGTNAGTALNNNRVIVSSGGTIGELALAGASGQFLESQGTGSAPIWGNALANPMTTSQDIIVGGAGGTPTRLAVGTGNSVLTVKTGGTVAWQPAASSTTGSYAQAYFGSSSSWTTGSASFVDPTNAGGNGLTVRTSNSITLTAASSNICGITFTPANNTAVYLIWAQVGVSQTIGGDGVGLQLTDGTTVISNSPGWDDSATAVSAGTITLSGVYAPATSSSVTVKVQAYAPGGAGTATLSAAGGNSVSVEWTVLRIF